jgi:acyl carrier protein
MEKEKIIEKIKNIVSERLSISPEKIQPDSNIIDDFDADSLDVVELILSFEESFEISIAEEEASKIKTIQEAANVIYEKKIVNNNN